jgi:hypothetical protein
VNLFRRAFVSKQRLSSAYIIQTLLPYPVIRQLPEKIVIPTLKAQYVSRLELSSLKEMADAAMVELGTLKNNYVRT